jgi:ribonuclease HI
VCFWRACQDILPTRDKLFRRKVISDPSCPICGLEAETIIHILWQCPSAQDVWSEGCIKVQKSSCSDLDFLQVAERILEKCDMEEFQNFVIVTRRIWLRRNAFLHEGSFSHPVSIIKQAESLIEEFNQAQPGVSRVCTQEKLPISGKWINPQQGWFKVNWDAAVGKQAGRIGLGAVIRNHRGEMVAARSLTRVGLLEPAAAEAVAAIVVIQLAREMGLQQIYVEGDAKVIVDAVVSQAPDWSRRGHLIEDIRSALRSFPHWTMAYVKRGANQAAHMVARLATAQVMDKTWSYDFPECLSEMCKAEQIALHLY